MSSRINLIALSAAFGAAIIGVSASSTAFAQALTVQECSVKYQAAKAGNTLNGLTWPAFRTSQCAANTNAAAPAVVPAAVAPAVAPKPPVVAAPLAPVAKPPVVAAPLAPAAKPPIAAAPAPLSAAVFPTGLNPAYSTLSAGIARRKTCDDQYKANKATGGNAGLEWIQKGGGYYSECNKKLKGI